MREVGLDKGKTNGGWRLGWSCGGKWLVHIIRDSCVIVGKLLAGAPALVERQTVQPGVYIPCVKTVDRAVTSTWNWDRPVVYSTMIDDTPIDSQRGLSFVTNWTLKDFSIGSLISSSSPSTKT